MLCEEIARNCNDVRWVCCVVGEMLMVCGCWRYVYREQHRNLDHYLLDKVLLIMKLKEQEKTQ
jgi:hypothetical protein